MDMRQPPSEVQQGSRCVVVLGSGRSGTSLTTQLLTELGIRFNYDPNHLSSQNPDGMFEDEFIVSVQQRLFSEGRLAVNLPLPDGWSDPPAVRALAKELEQYVAREFAGTARWGFKDPRTSVFLPLWRKIFDRQHVAPKYVICIREPGSVVKSLITNYQKSQGDAELVWLVRNIAALRDTGLNCFIVHYERLLADPERVLGDLAEFVLDAAPPAEQVQAVVRACIKKGLDRSSLNGIQLKNPLVSMLYQALNDCEGADFDRSRLSEVVQHCDAVLNAVAATARASAEEFARGDTRSAERAAQDRKLQQELGESKNQCAKLAAQTQQLSKELAEVEKRAAERAATSDKLQEDLAQAKADCTGLVAENQKLLRELVETTSRFEQIRAVHHSVRENASAMAKARDAARQEAAQLKAQVGKRTDEVRVLRAARSEEKRALFAALFGEEEALPQDGVEVVQLLRRAEWLRNAYSRLRASRNDELRALHAVLADKGTPAPKSIEASQLVLRAEQLRAELARLRQRRLNEMLALDAALRGGRDRPAKEAVSAEALVARADVVLKEARTRTRLQRIARAALPARAVKSVSVAVRLLRGHVP
jgi:hypothetical protein